MTDFDISASDDLIRQAVYSSDRLPGQHAGDRLALEGLSLPAWVGAMQGRRDVAAGEWPCWACHLHPGLTYLTWQGPAEALQQWGDEADSLVGQPMRCETPGDWLPRLRDAIVSLRQAELSAAASGRVLPYSLEDERHAFDLAVQHIAADQPGWPQTLAVWVGITLRRHHNQLDTVRRKVVELLSRTTRMVDQSSTLGHAFRAALTRLYATYDFAALPAVVEQSVRELIPHLLGRDPDRSRLGRTSQQALDHLRSHYTQPLSLADVAEAIHVSPAHLSRQFKQDTGRTLTDMLHSLRTARARQLLVDTDDTVLSIALACGFESTEHFHRIFKRHTGLTPHRYRQANA